MHPLLTRVHIHRELPCSFTFYSNLIDQILSFRKPANFAKSIHAQLIKLGFNTNTFLGNRCIDMYSKVNLFHDALNVFDEIGERNIFSWNICLKTLVKVGDIENARQLFDEMPERDVVSWNSMISGYISCGTSEKAWVVFLEMRKYGVRPSVFTFSNLISSVKCAFIGKQLHCCVIRNGADYSNLIVGNSLIDMYGKAGVLDYALGVFWSMEVDLISWNSLISGFCKWGLENFALDHFCLMRYEGYVPDEFTVSAVIAACSNLCNLEMGKQVLCLCTKMGSLSNTIVSSSAIDLFSKCNKLEDSVHIFDTSAVLDSALCNSMISSYARHGSEEKAFHTFVLCLRENIRPTEFTLSALLNCASAFIIVAQGSQVHSLVVKSGFESDFIVANSLVGMYSKFGFVPYALNIFTNMATKDLISWNTMILGLTSNGEVVESINLYKELVSSSSGLKPDLITLSAVLLACSYGGLLDEAINIFSSMQEACGIAPRVEHYACFVDMLSQAGKLADAITVLQTMPYKATAQMWESILWGCRAYGGDMELITKVAEKMVELQIESSLPYLVLAGEYEQSGRWERLVRVRRLAMAAANAKEKKDAKVVCRSWIGFGGNTFVFETNQSSTHGDEKNMYLLLRLLTWDMQHQNSVQSFMKQHNLSLNM